MTRLVAMCVVAAVMAASGCGGPDAKAEGEECFASSECGPGLVCDLAAEPPVCKGMGSNLPGPDGSPNPPPVFDAAPNAPDAAPGAPDAAPSPPDAAPDPPDAAAPLPDAAI